MVKNLLNNALNISKLLLQAVVSEGDTVIDATLGNGNDAAFLAERVGDTGAVYAFDIQEEALRRAEEVIPATQRGRVHMFCASHETMTNYVSCPVKLILFNLGYLPRGDKIIATQAITTVTAVKNGLSLLQDDGVIMLVVYRGHAGGKEEWEQLFAFVSTLEQHRYNVTIADFPNQKNDPPALICVQKRPKKG